MYSNIRDMSVYDKFYWSIYLPLMFILMGYVVYIFIPYIISYGIYTLIWGSKKNSNATRNNMSFKNNTGFKNNMNKNK